MFARFRNLFSKNKTHSEAETEANNSLEIYSEKAETSASTPDASCKLEGLNFLKSLVESEHQSRTQRVAENDSNIPNSLSEEVAELLKKRLLKHGENSQTEEEQISHETFKKEIEVCMKTKEFINSQNIEIDKGKCQGNGEIFEVSQSESVDRLKKPNGELATQENIPEVSLLHNEHTENSKTESKTELQTENINSSKSHQQGFSVVDKKVEDEIYYTQSKDAIDTDRNDNSTSENIYAHSEYYTKSPFNIETFINNSRENSPETSESSQSLSQNSIKEKSGHSTVEPLKHNLLETNLCNNSRIVVEDLPSEITTPSPTVESTISASSSNTSTLETPAIIENKDSSKIIINPINNNGLACNAITNKLSYIAEVAESLDAVIRDVQENDQYVEVESSPRPTHKKVGTLRSTSSEDWHSRSTEDDSFATASEGNFTPSSSSFHTASGRTSSFISCDKNSFDASEADDSTYAYEMPELTSPLNMSFEGSEQSYLSAQALNSNLTNQDEQKVPIIKLRESDSYAANSREVDQTSTADIEELHRESVTPTPEENYNAYHIESIPIDSEIELEEDGAADAPSMEVLTEETIMPMSRTPEVSLSNTSSNQDPIITNRTVNLVRDSNEQQEQQNSNTNNNNNIKPNAAWRRSKYYENITKQTIKGFL